MSHRQGDSVGARFESLEGRCLFSTLTVTTNGDSGVGSLRAQIDAAQSGDTIVFATVLSSPSSKPHRHRTTPTTSTPGTITLTSGMLFLTKNLTIQGPGAGQLTISGNAGSAPIQRGNKIIYTSSRVFDVAQNTTVTLSGLTITKGAESGIGNHGTLTVSSCTVSGSRATAGGGIYSDGTLTISGSTISGNAALYNGGGIYNVGGTVTISNSTLSANQSRFGGGIYNAGGAVTLSNSTVSGNTAYHADYPWSGGDGGGIYNDANGTLTVRNSSSITGNTSDWYDGLGPNIYNLGTIYQDGTSTIGTVYGNAAILI